jgi:hypothetical protein
MKLKAAEAALSESEPRAVVKPASKSVAVKRTNFQGWVEQEQGVGSFA